MIDLLKAKRFILKNYKYIKKQPRALKKNKNNIDENFRRGIYRKK